ncbi:MAG: hypothetical protein IT381_31205 [Deltaproteobacteria bacterium]|nr:hypothetical protein [Deltaproteobacteria bacterium]
MFVRSLLVVASLSYALPALADPPTYTEPSTAPASSAPFTVYGRPIVTPGGRLIPIAVAPKPRIPRYFGIYAALHVGLIGVDLQAGHFYGYLAGGVGWALLSDLRFGAFTGGAGYSVTIMRGRTSDWKLDILGMLGGGWNDLWRGESLVRYGYMGGGIGVGFRFEHQSGFSLGFKIPAFGYMGSPYIRRTRDGIVLFYMNAIASLPIVSFGYRF